MLGSRPPVAVALALTVCVTSGCFAHSSYQSAGIVEPDQPQSTVAAGRAYVASGNGAVPAWWTMEVMSRHALSRHVDMGMKLALLRGDEFGSVTLGFDWKVALLEDYLAADFGFGAMLSAIQAFHVFPGVIATVPVTRFLDVNAAAKTYVMPLATGSETVHACNIGLALKFGQSGLVLRPEIAVLSPVGAARDWVQFGVGIDLPHAPKKPGNRRSSRAP